MSTNTEIISSFFAALDAANLGYPISYPSITFQTPSTGNWLEVSFMPNEGIDQGIKSPTVVKQGLFQINVCGKPDGGSIPLYTISEQVAAVFPKNTVITGNVRISKTPYNTDIISLDDRQLLPLTMMYSE